MSDTSLATLYRPGQPDFEVFTSELSCEFNPLFASSLTNPPETTVYMTGSSTEQDLQGDFMRPTALQDMTAIPIGTSTWLNHDYSLPNSLFGSLLAKPVMVSKNGIADLHLASDTETSNEAAMKTLGYIRKGRKIGVSGGFKVLEAEVAGDDDDWFAPLIIHHVRAVEFSIVGIPSNQRSWVENAAYGLFLRYVVEDQGEEALKLAHIVKGLFSKDYADVVKRLSRDSGLRKELERRPARPTPGSRIYWEPAKKSFTLSHQGQGREVSRDLVGELLVTGAPALHIPIDDVVEKAATGKTSWPLMDIGTEWTGSKAEDAIFAYAKGDDGEITPSQAKQGFLYCDTSKDPTTKGAYKMPFCYGGDGGLKIVPLGVRACANVLAGGMGGGKFGGDDAAMKSKCKTMYGRINSQFSPDPPWQVPWEKEDSEESVEEDVVDTQKAQTLEAEAERERETGAEGVASTSTLVEEKDAEIGDIKIAADGSHAAMTGSHEHPHKTYGSQGNDTLHSHSHSHDSDANHGHHSSDSGSPASDDGESADTSGKSAEDIEDWHGAKALQTLVEPLALPTLAPETVTMLRLYNDLGKALGRPEVTPVMLATKCDLVATQGDAGIVRSMLSALDDCSDGMIAMAQRTDGYVDSLMQMMGVPDTNDDDSVGSSLSGYSLDAGSLTTKAGAEISGKNKSKLAMIHDAVTSMHPGACPATSTAGEQDGEGSTGNQQTISPEDARNQAQAEQDMRASYLASLTAMTEALAGFAGINIEAVRNEYVTTQASIVAARKELTELERMTAEALMQVEQVKTATKAFTHMPLGRPTLMQRSVAPLPQDTIGLASYDDLRQLPSGGRQEPLSLKEALALTHVEEVMLINPYTQVKFPSPYRVWPAGLAPEGGRPPLTENQQSAMKPWDVVSYQQNGEARVPMIDERVMSQS